MSNPLLYDKGTLLVAPGGGGALTPLPPGEDGQVLLYDSAEELGVRPGAGGAGDVTGPGVSTVGHLASYGNTSGDLIADSGVVAANAVTNAGTSTDNALARYDSTTGKIIQNSPVTCADTTGTMTWPAGGGSVLTAGASASERKGSITLSSGTHAKILTTAAVTGCVVVYTVVTLGTVTVASSFLTTIDTGVGFTPVASDVTDTSVVNWAIVA